MFCDLAQRKSVPVEGEGWWFKSISRYQWKVRLVRFKALVLHTRDRGFDFLTFYICGVEQLVARWAHNPKVVKNGSNPTPASNMHIPLLIRTGRLECAFYTDVSEWSIGEGSYPLAFSLTGSNPVVGTIYSKTFLFVKYFDYICININIP